MCARTETSSDASVTARRQDAAYCLALSGRLDSSTTGKLWGEALKLLEEAEPEPVVVDATQVTYCDAAGVALLMELQKRSGQAQQGVKIRGLNDQCRRALERFKAEELDVHPHLREEQMGLVARIGRATVGLLRDGYEQVEFVGKLLSALGQAARHPSGLRWKEVFIATEKVGANGLFIVLLIGFLMGLVMAFQAAVILQQFGAEVFVANFIGLSLVRELGPLVTAVVLAGRSGSAFAAELGTMEINDEINALETMGLDPVRLLVTARVLAAVAMMPFLTMFFVLAGVVGGAFVAFPMGIPLVTYANQVMASVSVTDLLGGLVKAVVLGLLVAAIGCLRGLQTERGASAVGDSATRAVVSGIILIALADGLFAVVYYYLGI
ncbi:MAG: ABC transporter permease [Candidatus Brocadiia bacterium]